MKTYDAAGGLASRVRHAWRAWRATVRSGAPLATALGAALVACLAVGRAGAEGAGPGDPVEKGRRIYVQGVLVSGEALSGVRASGVSLSGAAAACINCHRPSGMGTVESDIQMLPVTRPYLFPRAGDTPVAVMDLRFQHAMNVHHAPYTDATLARAVREGVNSDDKPMNELMPRYALGDADMAALTAYLKQLSSEPSPGVTGTRLHLATVVAPAVAPERRKAFLETLRAAVAQKNGSVMAGGRHMVSAAEIMLKTERYWDLHVWELKGDPSTWRGQLEDYYRAQPVFAVLSGISEGSWEPVQDFCTAQALPCLFPSVDLVPGEGSFYALYYSRGVLLEADVLARYLNDLKQGRPRRVIQVARDDEVGRAATSRLAKALEGSGIAVQARLLGSAAKPDFAAALKGVQGHDLVMFWLRRPDIAALQKAKLPAGTPYFSARLAGGELAPFPAGWRKQLRLVYPYMMPEQRVVALGAFEGWRRVQKIDLVDGPLQSEAFYAAVTMSETQAEMLNNVYRDYLIEREEEEIGRREAGKAEQLSRDVASSRTEMGKTERERIGNEREQMAADPSVVIRRESTTIYPRLGLGVGQHIASKGAYIVHFTGVGDALAADTGWIVP